MEQNISVTLSLFDNEFYGVLEKKDKETALLIPPSEVTIKKEYSLEELRQQFHKLMATSTVDKSCKLKNIDVLCEELDTVFHAVLNENASMNLNAKITVEKIYIFFRKVDETYIEYKYAFNFVMKIAELDRKQQYTAIQVLKFSIWNTEQESILEEMKCISIKDALKI